MRPQRSAGRAALGSVVLDIAYFQNQILSTEAFYMLMFTAFWLDVAVPVAISLWKPFCDAEPPPDYVAPPKRPDIREMTPEET